MHYGTYFVRADQWNEKPLTPKWIVYEDRSVN
jgi:hypothetical protein